jgi:hypothetical protein
MQSESQHHRSGFGVPLLVAVSLPIIVLVASLAISYQSSSVRRFSNSTWASYVALEVAESAIAEATHRLTSEHLFDPAIFGPSNGSTTFGADLLGKMILDQLPKIPQEQKEYWSLENTDGSLVKDMMVAFSFPERNQPQKISVPLTQRAAKENPGVVTDKPMEVLVKPLTFRREYYQNRRTWVNWGLMEFSVKVRVQDLRGYSTHQLIVNRLFSLKNPGFAGDEIFKISTRNLRTSTSQVEG